MMDYETLRWILSNKGYKYDVIGKSVAGRDIYCVEGGGGGNKRVLLVGAIHAREYITADILMRLFERQNKKICADIFVVPMLNPDGVELCKYGIDSVPAKCKEKVLKINDGNVDFSMWKANMRGVDINNNFDAGWDRVFDGRRIVPSPQGYYGPRAESEPETLAIVSLIKRLRPDMCIAFHTKGEELYFEYFNQNYRRDSRVAHIFAQGLKYKIVNCQNTSSAGLKDWCVEKLNMVAFTLECGSDNEIHPIKEDRLDYIYKKFEGFYQLINESVMVW